MLLAEAERLGWPSVRRLLRAGRGRQRLPRSGQGGDFLEHLPYVAGDDLRRLDWRASSRRDRPLVRRLEADAAARLVLCVDDSGSMGYAGGAGSSKLAAACELAAALSWAAMQAGVGVALASLASLVGGAPTLGPARRGAATWRAQVAALAALEAAGAADLAAALAGLAGRLRRPSALVIISDLAAPGLPLGRLLAPLARAGHGLLLVRVCPPDERGEADVPRASLASMEAATAGPVWGGGGHRDALRAHGRHLRAESARAGVVMVTVAIETPMRGWLAPLWRALEASGGGLRRSSGAGSEYGSG